MRLLGSGEGGFVVVLAAHVVVGLLCVHFLVFIITALHLWVVVQLCVVVYTLRMLLSSTTLLAPFLISIRVFIFTRSRSGFGITCGKHLTGFESAALMWVCQFVLRKYQRLVVFVQI